METKNRIYVSEMAYDLVGSEILKIAAEVNRLKAAGTPIVNFTVGDYNPAEFKIPAELTELVIDNYRKGQTNYPAGNGMAELRNSVVTFYKEQYGLEYTANEVVIGGGCRPLIYGFFTTILDPGDVVIFGTPSWNINHYCHLAGAVPHEIPTTVDNDFLPTAAEVAPHLEGASVLALCSPSNPTGTMYNRAELAQICALVLEENESRERRGAKPLYILYDQIYSQVIAEGEIHHHPVGIEPKLKDYVVYVDGASKSLAATGLRVGWALGAQPVIEKMSSILSHIGAWAPKPEQLALASYLPLKEANQVFNASLRERVFGRLLKLHNGFEEMASTHELPVQSKEPQGGIYLAARFDIIGRKTAEGNVLTTADDVLKYLMTEASVAMVPFYAFGSRHYPDWFRISVGAVSDAEIDLALKNIAAALTKLKPRF